MKLTPAEAKSLCEALQVRVSQIVEEEGGE